VTSSRSSADAGARARALGLCGALRIALTRCAGPVGHLASKKRVEVLFNLRCTGLGLIRIRDVLSRGTGCG
jgi:hypothetical protein